MEAPAISQCNPQSTHTIHPENAIISYTFIPPPSMYTLKGTTSWETEQNVSCYV